MKITMDNYEAFFLDYVEGRLDDSSVLEMLAFLRKHPELKEELECFSEMKLEPAQIGYKDKELLKKLNFKDAAVSLRNFDDFCIAYYEKELSHSESQKLFDFLHQNPDKKKDFQLYGEVFLKADPSVIFEGKAFLRKKIKAKTGIILLRWTSVAAGIVIAISVFFKSPLKEIEPARHNVAVIQYPSSSDSGKDIIPGKTPGIDGKEHKASAEIAVNREPVSTNQISVSDTDNINVEEASYLTPIEPQLLSSLESGKRPDLIISESAPISQYSNRDMELFDIAGKVIKKKVFRTHPEDPDKKISLWDLADITLKGYNRISENDIVLHRKTDENGRLTVIALETENRRYGKN